MVDITPILFVSPGPFFLLPLSRGIGFLLGSGCMWHLYCCGSGADLPLRLALGQGWKRKKKNPQGFNAQSLAFWSLFSCIFAR